MERPIGGRLEYLLLEYLSLSIIRGDSTNGISLSPMSSSFVKASCGEGLFF